MLNQISQKLAIKFYQAVIDTKKDLNQICCVIAIDCSRTIKIKNKILHLFLASGMIECFNVLEIPYSIVIFADYKFQYIIKKFEEPHSEYIIQRIFDCIIVERFRTRIADACYFINEKVFCDLRDYKAIFLISNGIDPKLNVGEQWNSIFDNKKNSFGFFFVHPTEKGELNEEDLSYLINMWNRFKNDTDTSVISINEDNIFNVEFPLISNFASVFKKLEPQFKELEKTINNEPFFVKNINLNVEDMEKFTKIIDNYSKEYSIYVQNNPHSQPKKKYNNDNIKIIPSFITSNIQTNNLNEINSILSSILNELKDIKINEISLAFPPNKPSMYIPSIKGNRLYIIGLINFVLTDVQDNKIF